MGTQSKVKRRVSKAFIHEHRWVIPKRYFVMNFLVTAGAVWLVLMLAGCGPGLTEVLEKGFKCKATITIPEGAREGDVIEVEVKIYNCIELKGEDDDGTKTEHRKVRSFSEGRRTSATRGDDHYRE